METEFTLGIDMAKDSFVAALLDRNGERIRPVTTFQNNDQGFRKLLKFIPKPKQTNILLESTGVYGKQFLKALSSDETNLFELNPQVIKRLASSMVQTKTDEADAVAIAKAGRFLAISENKTLEKYRVTYDPHRENLALWTGEYKRISSIIARLKTQIKSMEHQAAPKTEIILNRRRVELKQIQGELKNTKKEIEALLKEQNDAEAQCLLSIPGVGPLTTAAALVSIRNINRFESADALKAYWGIYPRRRQSGKRELPSRMAKHGNKLVRHALWNAAKTAARFNPVCKELFERLIAKGKTAPSAYGAVARKLVQLIYGVLKSKTIFQSPEKST